MWINNYVSVECNIVMKVIVGIPGIFLMVSAFIKRQKRFNIVMFMYKYCF